MRHYEVDAAKKNSNRWTANSREGCKAKNGKTDRIKKQTQKLREDILKIL